MNRITKATLLAIISPSIAYWYLGRKGKAVKFFGWRTACILGGGIFGAIVYASTDNLVAGTIASLALSEISTALSIVDIRRIVREQEALA